MAKYTLTRDGMNPIETDREDVRLQYAAAGYKTTVNEADPEPESQNGDPEAGGEQADVDAAPVVAPNGDQDTQTVTPGYARGGRLGRG